MLGLELLFDAIADWCLQFAPKPVRIGCTALLLMLAAALLGWALWNILT